MMTWVMASLRGRLASAIGVVVAVLVGVVITTATTQILVATRPQPPERLAAASVMVAGEQGVDVLGRPGDRAIFGPAELESLIGQFQAMGEVEAVVADLSLRAQIVGPQAAAPAADDSAAGHSWSSSRLGGYRITAGAAPLGPEEVVLGPEFGARPGDTVRLRTTVGERDVTVSGTTDGPGIYLDDGTAKRLAPAPSTLGIFLHGSDGVPTDRLQEVAAGHHGEVVLDRSVFEDTSVSHQRYLSNQFLLALALASVVITLFVVAVTSKFAVDARTREFGLLRAIGVLPRTVRGSVLGEALVLGLAGAAAGVVVGLPLVPVLASVLRNWGILPAGLSIPVDLAAALCVAAGGMVTSVLAASLAAVSASRVSPLAAMGPESARPTTRRWGRVFLGGLAAVLVVVEVVHGRTSPDADSVTMAIVIALTSAVATVCLAPLVIPAGGALVLRVVTRFGRRGPLLLGAAEVVTQPQRAASLAAPVIMAVTLSTVLSGFIPTMRVAYPAETSSQLPASSVLVPEDDAHLTDEQVAAAVSTYDVQRVARSTRAHVRAGDTDLVVPVTTLPADAPADQFIVPRYLADQSGWAEGDRVDLTMADGQPVTATISAITDAPRGEHPGVELPEQLIREHDPSAVASEVFLRDRARTDSSAVQGTMVQSAEEWSAARYDKDLALLNRYLLAFVALAVGYAVLACIITIAMTMRHRRSQLRTLSRLGALPPQIRHGVMAEAAIAGLGGVALGVLGAILPLREMAAGLSVTAGQRVGVHLGWLQAIGVPVVTVLLMTLAAALAVRPPRTARPRTE